MKSKTEYLWFETKQRRELVNVTETVAKIVTASGIREGLVLVSAMHITAGVFVNDHEPGLWNDIWSWLQKLAPEGPDYEHHRTGEDNGDAHLKSSCITRSLFRSPTASSISGRGSRSSMRSSMAAVASVSS